MSQKEQQIIFKNYTSNYKYGNWTSSSIGGGENVQDLNVNGTYYSDVGGFDYIVGDDGNTYYALNRNYKYDENGNIVVRNSNFDYEDFFDYSWRKL